MRIIKWRLGVSQLESGEKVLTPFGLFGRAYSYSPNLHRRFQLGTKVAAGLGSAYLVLVLILLTRGVKNLNQTIELISTGIVFFDLLRILTTRIALVGVSQIRLTSRLTDTQKDQLLINSKLAWVPIIIMSFFTLVEFLYLLLDALGGTGSSVLDSLGLFVCYGIVYVAVRYRVYLFG